MSKIFSCWRRGSLLTAAKSWRALPAGAPEVFGLAAPSVFGREKLAVGQAGQIGGLGGAVLPSERPAASDAAMLSILKANQIGHLLQEGRNQGMFGGGSHGGFLFSPSQRSRAPLLPSPGGPTRP